MKNKGISHNSNGSRKTDVTSRVIRDNFFDRIWKSAEMTDIKMNEVNQYYDEKYQVKPGVEKENEATYKAVLYRELTESSIKLSGGYLELSTLDVIIPEDLMSSTNPKRPGNSFFKIPTSFGPSL